MLNFNKCNSITWGIQAIIIGMAFSLTACGTLVRSKSFTLRQVVSVHTGATEDDVITQMGTPSLRRAFDELSDRDKAFIFGNTFVTLDTRKKIEVLSYWKNSSYTSVSSIAGTLSVGTSTNDGDEQVDFVFYNGYLDQNLKPINTVMLSQVHDGMTVGEVTDILGKPLMYSDYNWIYYFQGPIDKKAKLVAVHQKFRNAKLYQWNNSYRFIKLPAM